MRKNLYFFDATCPLIRAESIDFDKMFAASRYDKGEADFFNIPLSQAQYDDFVLQLTQARPVEMREFEKNMFFDACLPIEEIARRGQRALAFRPLETGRTGRSGQRSDAPRRGAASPVTICKRIFTSWSAFRRD